MDFTISVPDFAKVVDGIEGDIARGSTAAMRRATDDLKGLLRDQILRAGLGDRLAKTWRGETYPEGRNSTNPAGYIWSRAPAIIESYARGATIRPIGAHKYLWIPTANVPRRRGRVDRSGISRKGGAMTPEEVEDQFNTDFTILRGKRGTLLAFIDVVRSRNQRGWRRDTAGRRAQGRAAQRVLMFVLVRSVTKPRLFDLSAAGDFGADRFINYLGEELQRG